MNIIKSLLGQFNRFYKNITSNDTGFTFFKLTPCIIKKVDVNSGYIGIIYDSNMYKFKMDKKEIPKLLKTLL